MAIPIQWDHLDVTSSSHRPILLSAEQILFVQANVGLYNGKHKLTRYQNGVLYLTTHRICYVDTARSTLNSIALQLGRIDKIEHYAGFLKSSPKISIKCTNETTGPSSGSATPVPSALVPARQKGTRDWICPICTFTNILAQDIAEGIRLPACTNCGMLPPKNTKVSSGSSTPISSAPVGSNLLSQAKRPTYTGSQSGLTFPCPRCTFGNHPAITSCELCGAPLLSRNLPPVLNSNDNIDERGSSPAPPDGYLADDGSFKLSFRSSGDKAFLEKLRQAIVERAWQIKANVQSKEPSELRVRGAGIGALQSREESIRSQNATTMSGAFEDLAGLMKSAKDMISLAESLAKRISSAPSTVGPSEARSLILESSAALGLSSPVVTKELAGRATVYHSELARQLSEFLDSGVLRAEGGVMTLVDLYAVYNRARQGYLISPDDLLAACKMLATLRLPFALRRFKSGVVVIQDTSRTDESTRRVVLKWIQSRTTGASALDAVEMFGWSVSVATEELEMVEEHGDIVRDVGIEGVQFYENSFQQLDCAAWFNRISLQSS